MSTPAALVQLSSGETVERNAAWHSIVGAADPFDLLMAAHRDRGIQRLSRGAVYRVEGTTGVAADRHWVFRPVGEGLVLVEGHDDHRARERDTLVGIYSDMMTEHSQRVARERERAERLLRNVLPQHIVRELKETGKSEPELFESASVLFLDFVGFTSMPISRDPSRLFGELNDIFTIFDEITELHGCERIKTIGDAYLAVAGMPVVTDDHALRITSAALGYIDALAARNLHSEQQWLARVGIHSGEVVGGIVGVKKYIYDVFGDTINTAARMEAGSAPMRVNVSETTYRLIEHAFRCQPRTATAVKGKGMMQMYFVEEKR